MNFILTRRRTAAAAVGGLEICIWMELYRLQFDVFPYVGDTWIIKENPAYLCTNGKTGNKEIDQEMNDQVTTYRIQLTVLPLSMCRSAILIPISKLSVETRTNIQIYSVY